VVKAHLPRLARVLAKVSENELGWFFPRLGVFLG